ncbi:MAG TPA: YdcF family protein [Firmicutes bacterium]|nr:YdcF family protein [Bacillota bacterium]
MNRIIAKFELTLGAVCFVYYFICAAYGGFGVPLLSIWPTGGAVLILKSLFCIKYDLGRRRALKFASVCFDCAFIAFFAGYAVFAGFATGDMNETPPDDCDCIIVLGAGVNGSEPSEALQNRIDAAYDYLISNPETFAVGSGGLGEDADISEGELIAESLIEMGIPAGRVAYEDRSTTTVENMKFALEKIPDDAESVAVVSSGFHIFRAKLILSNYTGMRVYGAAATGADILSPHYILREYIVFIIDILLGNYGVV